MMSVAAITPNQIRQLEGMPGYGKEGENYYIATNNYSPVGRLDEIIDADIEQKTKPTAAPAAKPETPTKEQAALQEAAAKFLATNSGG